MRNKVEFNSNGHTLAGLLETPESDVRAFALFAHCFTCGKDIAAASRIAGALTQQGIAVLRFDFTGLGSSDGDFANTNFSSNMQDLLAATEFLRAEYQAPSLLIGHSLGGAAVLAMAHLVPEAKAVATIGAPFGAAHVAHNFAADIDVIEAQGEAEVDLAGRKFVIKKQFLDDIKGHSQGNIESMKKALLVMHAPLDATVSISEAEKIYQAAKHPKSFISLDDADHLLSKKSDAIYAAQAIASWASRYLPEQKIAKQTVKQGHVIVSEKDHVFTQHVSSDSHYWLADEPKSVGGANTGPDPYEHLLAGLGACTAMTIRMYAKRKQLPLSHVEVELSHSRNYFDDCDQCPEQGLGINVMQRHIRLEGDLSDEQRQRLLEIADKCPVHKTLEGDIRVITGLV